MNGAVKEAIKVLRNLPENEQESVVRAIFDLAGRDEELLLSEQ